MLTIRPARSGLLDQWKVGSRFCKRSWRRDPWFCWPAGIRCFFGIGRLLTQYFPAEQLAFYPQVSSVQLALNRLQIPWQEATILSLHGRGVERLQDALRQGSPLIVALTDPEHTPAAVAQFIADLRLPVRYQGWVCSQLGSPPRADPAPARRGEICLPQPQLGGVAAR